MVFQIVGTVKSYFLTLNQAPEEEVVWGVVLGMFVGILPVSISSFIIALLLFLLKTDKTSGFISAGLFGALGIILDPLAHQIGYFILVKIGFLKPIFTFFYNMPFVPFTNFNNTIVMGNTFLGLLLAPFVMQGTRKLLRFYRSTGFKDLSHKILENKHVNAVNKIFNLKNKVNLDQITSGGDQPSA